ncbi:glycerophosphodiester phosphodiesterase [Paenibacillus psychroresistens]|uniref:Glycerophosphodiester phosphodiesterase n=1 Tax=Paenibacillus psychroresistens TaxID=1778678 RepID=A0A6B8RH77_9BACL|nr:glycerophosphodiester phosphodiesterase [Paenibacillus psychroresistens]QGQ94738.1 glycerophosphodiester phosphodiesterase [Paenibacillus psychroresistens]
MSQSFPWITAHSGCMNKPDNTLASAEIALQLGADIVEDDIRITSDGILVLAHDDEIQLPNGTIYHISQMTYSELSELDILARSGTVPATIRLATLESFLQLIKAVGKIANLDLKADECIKPVSDLVEKYQMLEQVIVSGCEAERAMKVNQINPKLRKLLNANIELFLSLDYEEAVEITCNDALAANCMGINIEYRLVKTKLLEAAWNKNLPILVWTVNDEIEMKRMVEMGVHSITTRNLQTLIDLKQLRV